MPLFPKKLQTKLEERSANHALRGLSFAEGLIDFSSNDYLGNAREATIFKAASELLKTRGYIRNGAGGSRLLTGNYPLYKEVEAMLAGFHQSDTALVFNSGYDANIGFFASVPQRGDVILYDELAHASIRDGIQMSRAKSYKFKHNNIPDLKAKIARAGKLLKDRADAQYFVVTEAVFSMDGDTPDLRALAAYCDKDGHYLVVDEAHALGVLGTLGEGLVQQLHLQQQVFARLITFGKAMGCHGAAILGSQQLKTYLVNYARSFVYTTGLPPHTIATVLEAYTYSDSKEGSTRKQELRNNINFFKQQLNKLKLESQFVASNSAIQSCVIPGNQKVRDIAKKLQQKGFDVRPILSPTVPVGSERLRFCLHSYNTKEEIEQVLQYLANFV